MKLVRKACCFFIFFIAYTSVFCQTNEVSSYFVYGKLIDTMYVNSLEGLKIRSDQTLESKKLAVIPDRLPVKIIKIGNITTIDNIKAPWIKILIPCYLWDECGTHFGWVFGGYLKTNQSEFTAHNWNSKEYITYLINKTWTLDSNEYMQLNFYSDGTYRRGIIETDIGEYGTWSISDDYDAIIFNRKGVMHEDTDETYSAHFSFSSDGSFFLDKDQYHIFFDYFDDSLSSSFYYLNKDRHNYLEELGNTSFFYQRKCDESKIAEYKEKCARKAIEVGVSAKGTEYADLYPLYWKDRENPSWTK